MKANAYVTSAAGGAGYRADHQRTRRNNTCKMAGTLVRLMPRVDPAATACVRGVSTQPPPERQGACVCGLGGRAVSSARPRLPTHAADPHSTKAGRQPLCLQPMNATESTPTPDARTTEGGHTAQAAEPTPPAASAKQPRNPLHGVTLEANGSGPGRLLWLGRAGPDRSPSAAFRSTPAWVPASSFCARPPGHVRRSRAFTSSCCATSGATRKNDLQCALPHPKHRQPRMRTRHG